MLGSGSRGNATLVGANESWILVDAGFSGRQIEARLSTLGVDMAQIDAVVITHEHGDHTRGMGVLARRHDLPLYMTAGTQQQCAKLLTGAETIRPYRPGRPFRIGTLRFEPFLTVHDAVDPVAVTVVGEECGTRIGVATDLGRPTAQIRHSLAHCDFLILEANHDERLLQESSYPASVKGRIGSSHGHLSNRAAARFALELLHPRLSGILLAHLSERCNRPELARDVLESVLGPAGYRGFLGVALQDEPTPLLDIGELRLRTGPEQLTLL